MNNRLLEIRKVLQMSQREFAEKFGLKPSSYSDIERGRIQLSERNIIALCSVYNVNRNWLETGKGEMFNIKDVKFDEFFELFQKLSPPLQDFLINTAKELLKAQFKL